MSRAKIWLPKRRNPNCTVRVKGGCERKLAKGSEAQRAKELMVRIPAKLALKQAFT